MIEINKYNYEAYYLDFLEKNLSSEDEHILFNFLSNNPDLKAELELDDDILEFNLIATKETVLDKDDYKYFSCFENEICLNNIDFWMVMMHENSLSEIDKKRVILFISENQLSNEYKAIQATTLIPNLNEKFSDINSLKKKETVIIPFIFRMVGVAAAITLLITLFNQKEIDSIYYSRSSINPFNIDLENSEQFEFNLIKENSNEIIKSKNKNEIALVSIDTLFIPEEKLNDTIIKSEPQLPLIQNTIKNENILVENKTTQPKYKDVFEEPYKPISKAINNYTSLDVTYKISPKTSDYKTTKFKVGKFSFERKRKK